MVFYGQVVKNIYVQYGSCPNTIYTFSLCGIADHINDGNFSHFEGSDGKPGEILKNGMSDQ